MNLDIVRTGLVGRLDLVETRINKKGYGDLSILQKADISAEIIPGELDLKPPFRRQFSPFFRHQRNLIRGDGKSNIDDLFRNGHLKVQRCGHKAPQPPDIIVLNVPAVLPKVAYNAVRPFFLTDFSSDYWIRVKFPPSLTQCSYMVDINSEFNHNPLYCGYGY